MIFVFVIYRIVLMMDREERSVFCTCAINLSAQNSALRIATAFSKGLHWTLWAVMTKALPTCTSMILNVKSLQRPCG